MKHAAVKHSARAVARQAKAGARQTRAGEAAARRAAPQTGGRRWLTRLPYCLVLAGMAAGLATARGGGQAVKSGTVVIAGALLAGSLMRLVLPDDRAGMLASRRRLVDVAVLAALGAGLLVAGLYAVVAS